MRTIIRDTNDLDPADRTALQRVLGEHLDDHQRLVIGIVDLPRSGETAESGSGSPPAPALPDWCNVYEGLSDEEIADLERIILRRADLSRPS